MDERWTEISMHFSRLARRIARGLPLSMCVAAVYTEPASAVENQPAASEVDSGPAVDVVVVTGSRTERPLSDSAVATEVITRADIEASGAQSVSELLEEHPGIYLDRSFAGAGPQLQGLPPDYTLVLIDGVRQPGRVNGVIDFDRFAIENVERVEIVRGASSALYGSDAMGGVINIITRGAKRPFEGTLTGSAGAYGTIDASAGAGVRRASASARAFGGYHESDGFDLDPSDVATTQPNAVRWNAGAQGTLSPSRELTLGLGADYRRQERDSVDINAAGGAVFDRQSSTETLSVLSTSTWRPVSGARVTARAGFSIFRDQFLLDQRGAADLDELSDTREHMAQLGAQLDVLAGTSHLLSAGTEGWYETLSTPRLATARGERMRGAVYVQDEWTLGDEPLLVLLPGARADVDSQFGAFVAPRAALRFDPSKAVTLRASHGWGFKAPDFRELYLLFENPSAGYLVEGNSALEPERSRSWNAGVELRAHRAVWVSLQGFWNELRDRIGTDLVPATDNGPRRFRYRNIASGTSRGVEASVQLRPLRGLRLDLGHTWTQTRDDGEDRPFSGQPQHRATASLRYSAPEIGFETLWRGAFVGRRPFYRDLDGDDVDERIDAGAYASVDLRVAQRVGQNVTTFVLAENVLDAGHHEFLPVQPRNFSGGVQLDY